MLLPPHTLRSVPYVPSGPRSHKTLLLRSLSHARYLYLPRSTKKDREFLASGLRLLLFSLGPWYWKSQSGLDPRPTGLPDLGVRRVRRRQTRVTTE